MHVISHDQIAKYLKLFRNIGGVDDLKLSSNIGGIGDLKLSRSRVVAPVMRHIEYFHCYY